MAFPNWPRLSRLLVLLTCTITTTLYATTITIANVSLPQIQGAMSATPDQIAWVVTSNLIATAITIPAAGWLSARLGRRRTMIYGVSGFTVATIMCGLSNSLEELIVWRVLQSACGSPITPVSQSIVIDQFQGKSRGPAMAVFGLGVTLGPTIAPLAGGEEAASRSSGHGDDVAGGSSARARYRRGGDPAGGWRHRRSPDADRCGRPHVKPCNCEPFSR